MMRTEAGRPPMVWAFIGSPAAPMMPSQAAGGLVRAGGAAGPGVHRTAGAPHDAVAAGRGPDQGGAVIEPALRVEDGIEIRRQPGLDVRWEVPGGENPGFAGCHKHYAPCAALPKAIIVVFRGHGYYAWLPGYKA